MKYLINSNLIYDVDSGSILRRDSNEKYIKLSNQAGRLLHELVINYGRINYRDVLIQKIWEEHGFSGSSIALNVAISEIRKSFREMEHDPLIIKTVRGKGFILTAQVEYYVGDVLTEKLESRIYEKKSKIKLKPYVFGFAIALIFFINIFITVVMFFSGGVQFFTQSKRLPYIYYLGRIDMCNVNLIDKNIFKSKEYYFSKAKKLISKNNIDCNNQLADIYYSNFEMQRINSYFLSICYKVKGKDDHKNCISYKETSVP